MMKRMRLLREAQYFLFFSRVTEAASSCEMEQRNNEKHVEAASKMRWGRKVRFSGEYELKLLHSSTIINAFETSLKSCAILGYL